MQYGTHYLVNNDEDVITMNRIFYSLIILLCFLLGSVFDGSATDTGKQDKFRRVGYFKDSKRNRIYTIAFKPGTTEKEVLSYAEQMTYTQGRMMAAYFYPEGSAIPADGVTLARSIFQANNILYDLPGLSCWRYAFMRYFKGTTEFIDCQQTPNSDLCRKK